jgi:hypothetical protein
MTDQEILNRIDAEIAEAQAVCDRLERGSPGYAASLCGHIGFVNGLKFARALIEKRKEEVAF